MRHSREGQVVQKESACLQLSARQSWPYSGRKSHKPNKDEIFLRGFAKMKALKGYQNADNSCNNSFYLVLKSSSSSSSIGILRSTSFRGEEENNYFKGALY